MKLLRAATTALAIGALCLSATPAMASTPKAAIATTCTAINHTYLTYAGAKFHTRPEASARVTDTLEYDARIIYNARCRNDVGNLWFRSGSVYVYAKYVNFYD